MRQRIVTSKEGAEKMFNRKASPDASLPPKQFLKKKLGGFKAGVVDKVSDAMSYPARRNAQKAMIKADRDVADIKMVREAKGTDTSDKDHRDPLFRARANVAVLKAQAQRDALKTK